MHWWKKMVSLSFVKIGTVQDVLYLSIYVNFCPCFLHFSPIWLRFCTGDADRCWVSFVKMIHWSLYFTLGCKQISICTFQLIFIVGENQYVASEHNAVDYFWVLWKLQQGRSYFLWVWHHICACDSIFSSCASSPSLHPNSSLGQSIAKFCEHVKCTRVSYCFCVFRKPHMIFTTYLSEMIILEMLWLRPKNSEPIDAVNHVWEQCFWYIYTFFIQTLFWDQKKWTIISGILCMQEW